MVKKAKLLLPLFLSLTSIFCVGYAGWTLSGTGISTNVNASVGDVKNILNYISFDTTQGAENGIQPFEYVASGSAIGFVNDGLIGNNALMSMYLIFDIKNYWDDFDISGAFDLNFSISLSENTYISSSYIDSLTLGLNTSSSKTRYIYATNFAGAALTTPAFNYSPTNLNLLNGVLSFADFSSYFNSYDTLRIKLCFDFLFSFSASKVTELINNIANVTFSIGVSF